MQSLRIVFGAALILLLSQSRADGALQVGDDAPEIHVSKWVNGGPISIADGKGSKVFVVEFWATWCGPCKATIPHLSELYTKLKPRGVEIVGISQENIATIEKFMPTMHFTYNVGADDGGKTSAVYMEGVRGIPHAFIVDKAGKIAWKGHPMNGLDAALEGILSGNYDPEAAAKVAGLKEKLQSQLQQRDIEGGLLTAKEVLRLDPNDKPAFDVLKQIYEYQKDDAAFKALCGSLLKRDLGGPALNNLAWTLLTAQSMSFRDIDLAHEAATKAVAKRRDAAVVDTLARVYFELGLIDRAIGLQKEAIRIAKGLVKQNAESTLEYYESVKKAAARLRFR